MPDLNETMPEFIKGLPNICGSEPLLAKANAVMPNYLDGNGIDFSHVKSAFGIALHMHQPLIPAGGGELCNADIISNLKYMMDNPGIGDNHNAGVFHQCYKRIGDFVPQLVDEGKQPRVMLDYSGNLFYGLRQMGLDDVLDNLKRVTCDMRYRHCVEWLGNTWSHAVAPSTPVQDFRLHVQAWRHHFAAIFGLEALSRVKGFSPAEMALPNHPDVAYEFVKTLKDNGYLWLLVQEHSVELPSGQGLERKHVPHRLVARNSKGEEISMIALIKTQGSDTKLVAQMQPYYEAQGLERWQLNGKSIPPMVSQIGDGENGGVMMNEFPSKFFEVMNSASHSDTPALNGTEYLQYLFSQGFVEDDFPTIQPAMQHRIWNDYRPPKDKSKASGAMNKHIQKIKQQDDRFHMDGGSWTNDISWVRGYENVLGPMDEVSIAFNNKVLQAGIPSHEHRYRNALFYLLMTQTSCYRYWGQGLWTDYAQELCRRAGDILKYDF